MGNVIDANEDILAQQRAAIYIRDADDAFREANYLTAAFLYRQAIDSFSGLLKAPPSLYKQLSKCLLYKRRFKESVKALEDCLEQHPRDAHVLAQLGLLHIDRWEEIQDPARAAEYFARVKELEPNYRSGCLNIDLMLTYAKLCAEKEEDIRR